MDVAADVPGTLGAAHFLDPRPVAVVEDPCLMRGANSQAAATVGVRTSTGSLYVGISSATRMPFGASVIGVGGWLSMFHTDDAFRMRPAAGPRK
jgi:hypothetical protein